MSLLGARPYHLNSHNATDSFQVPTCQIAAVECQQMIVRQAAIAFSAIPKHASFYVHTGEIPVATLEAVLVPPARA